MKAYIVMLEEYDRKALEPINVSLQKTINCLTEEDFKREYRLYDFWDKLRYKEESSLCAMFQVYRDWVKKDCHTDMMYIVVECDGKKYGICENDYFSEMEIECDFT